MKSIKLTKNQEMFLDLFWLTYYINPGNGLCIFCDNSGVFHGNDKGKAIPVYCLCPNGRAKRQFEGQNDNLKRKLIK